MSTKSKLNRDALNYHAKPNPGKISVIPTKKHTSQRDLALAYSPGVAAPCLEIEKDHLNAYKYTSKGNLVAVISNGTAVLGLGDIGALAGKPVMEGKGLLFKIFSDIDVFDIELDEKDPDKFVETVKAIAPTFGGINLEDIKAPEAFEIERRLKEELDIPVMHDDQHGTAIISAAGLLNASEIVGKKLKDIRVVVNGAGASAVSCSRLYKKLGVKSEHIIMVDSKGVIRKDREDLSPQKQEFATDLDFHSLEDAIEGADMFLGLSKADILKPEMLKKMAKNPIVFALANPNPEIEYKLAMRTRDDILMATGRSDYPNQVNNVLGFPYIFRGALDVRATTINEEMKLAAVHALANLTKEPVPEQVNITYGETHLEFGKDYIIPKPFDMRLIEVVPMAVAKAAMDTGVAKEPIKDWDKYREQLSGRLGGSSKYMKRIINRAKSNPQRVVFAEAEYLDVLKAAQIVYDEGIAFPILLGRERKIKALMEDISFDMTDDIQIIDPKDKKHKKQRDQYVLKFWEKRQRFGVKHYDAESWMKSRNIFGAMMVIEGDADTIISGYTRSYSNVVKPMLEIVGKRKDVSEVAATNLMLTDRGPLFLSDTAVNVDPDEKVLASIIKLTAETMQMFGIKPNMAMLSYANFGSSEHPMSSKMSQTVKYMHKHHPELDIDGEIQADFALNQSMMKDRFPFAKIAGKKVNALIFPQLSSANITYKIMKELNGIESVGPILMGMDKPIHIVQLGASVDEMVNMTTIAVVDAQRHKRKK
ncbi:MAG: NADP-dependent malic enzyme [Flavobacteriales bacterium]|nr:MAG: NADP-dependent malic enzyme [Flavobacteriales bacterium]